MLTVSLTVKYPFFFTTSLITPGKHLTKIMSVLLLSCSALYFIYLTASKYLSRSRLGVKGKVCFESN